MHSELNGIVVVDKPAGQSSAQTIAEVKKLFGVKKCGHTGTLDPFATGVLICCLNQATRLARFFLHSDKKYEAILRLGISTDTQDFTGRTTATEPVPDITDTQLQKIFQDFEGPQLQQPPVFAALKHNGTPLYKLARLGKPIQKEARPVTIRQLRIMNIRLPDIEFQVACSAGTYVRTICADIGLRLGCGGHLAQLRRIASGGYTLAEAATLPELKEKKALGYLEHTVLPMTEALRDMPMFTADEQVLEHIRHGRQLNETLVPKTIVADGVEPAAGRYIKVVNAQHQLKAVIEQTPDGLMYNYCCVFH